MPTNVEIKARVRDLPRLRARVREVAGERQALLQQEDIFFCAPRGRLKLRHVAQGTAELIHYARADARGPKASLYRIAPVAAPDALRGVLAAALGERGVVRKRRELHMAGRTRIHLDEVEGLGAFLELEVVLQSGETTAEGEAVAQALISDLQVDPADFVAAAYIDLLALQEAPGPPVVPGA